jgi:hypothetical protein
MIRSAASKVMWVGRATVFMVGFAVILALVLGAATTALAHTNVDNKLFHLNHNNNVTTTLTKLTGTLAGTVLKLDNNGTGPALSLEAGTNRAPLMVNAAAGTATGLSADELDGKNSTDFARAYKRTVVVSPVGSITQNGTALKDALASITNASSATNSYLLKIEPGTYDLGSSGSLEMKEHVDIEGSGELKTLITSNVSSDGTESSVCPVSTVAGADDAELRFLTVRNTGAGNCNIAIRNSSASLHLTHVTAESIGGGGGLTIGVYNSLGSSLTMSNATATASGGNSNVGVYSVGSSAIIKHSTLSGNTNALFQGNGGTTKVALTEFVLGGASKDVSGTVQCFANYFNASLSPVPC